MLRQQHLFIWCICTNLIALFCVPVHTQEFNNVRIQTTPVYAIASKADLLNSTTCGKELQNFRDAVDQQILWSLKVLDSSGGYKPGYFYGNNYWLGSRSQCLDMMTKNFMTLSWEILNNTQYNHSQQKFSPFEINYFVAHFRHNNTLQHYMHVVEENVITLGLCLPASCSTNNLSFILERILHDKVILTFDFYSTDLYLIQVKDLKYNDKWLSGGALFFICIGLGFCFMTTIGTIYDVFINQKSVVVKNEMNETNGNIKDESKRMEIKLNPSSHWKSVIGTVLICFSAYTNTKKMFSTKLNTGTIPVLEGLKVINMCFIIALHVIVFEVNFFDNKVWMWKTLEICDYLIDPMIGLVSVDIYLFSSGFLVAHWYLRDKANKILIKPFRYTEKLNELFINIVKRFLRLTPTYIIVLGITQLSSVWFDNTSQFYAYEKYHKTCAKYWWRNLLYINNLFAVDELCMNWSWYLAVDTQCYVIVLMILILLTMYFYVAVIILGALLIGSIILTGYISYVYEYIPSFHELYRFANVLYLPPWTRINSFIIGAITSYILIKLNNILLWKKKIIVLCWCVFCLASACNILVLFAINKRYVSVLGIAVYIALQKTLWAIGLAWIVIACTTKHGGIVNKLLSFKGWIPLSRLTYCVFLLHPIIIQSISLHSETSIHFEFLPYVVLSVGYIVISYLCAYALSMIVEMPSLLLMQTFLQNRNRVDKKVL